MADSVRRATGVTVSGREVIRYYVYIRAKGNPDVFGVARANIEIKDVLDPARLEDTKRNLEVAIADSVLSFEWVMRDDREVQATQGVLQ
jgi:hypothetical protein